MRYLITTGMRAHYSQEMAKLEAVYSVCGEEELIEAAKAVNPSANEDSYLPKMLSAWRRYGENALLGWDVGRCCLVSQWCYLCGYLSMEALSKEVLTDRFGQMLDNPAPKKQTRQK